MTTTTTTAAQFATDVTSTWIVVEITATGERITKVEQVNENTARQLAAIYNHHRTANGSSFEAVDTAAPAPVAEITLADVDAAWIAWEAATAAWRAGSDDECNTLHAAVKEAHAHAVALQAAYRAQSEAAPAPTLPQPGIVARYDDEYTWPARHRFDIQAWIERREAGFYAVVRCGDEREESGPVNSLAQQPRLQAWINERCHQLVLWCAALGESFEIVPDGTPADSEAEGLADTCATCSGTGTIDTSYPLGAEGWERDSEDCPDCAPDPELLPFTPTADEARATLLEAEAQAGVEVCEIPGCAASVAYVSDTSGLRVCRGCHQDALSAFRRQHVDAIVWAMDVMRRQFEIEVESRWDFLGSDSLVTTRVDGQDFTPEQMQFLAGYSEGYHEATALVFQEVNNERAKIKTIQRLSIGSD